MTAGYQRKPELSPLNVGGSFVAWAVCGSTSRGAHYLSLVYDLALWNPFPMEGNLVWPKYRGEDLGPASSDVTDFVDSSWKSSPSLRSGWWVE